MDATATGYDKGSATTTFIVTPKNLVNATNTINATAATNQAINETIPEFAAITASFIKVS